MAPPLILWPIVPPADVAWGIRVTTGLVTETLYLPAAGTLTGGRCYWMSGDAQADADGGVGGVGDLIGLLQAALNTNTGGGTYAVALTDGHHLQVACTGAQFTLLWDDAGTTADPEVFGFEPDSYTPADPGAGLTSPLAVKGWWVPGRLPTEDSRERQPVVGGIATTMLGAVRVSRLATPRKVRDIAYRLVPQEIALAEYADALDPHGAAETMWLQSLARGYPIRWYEDGSAMGASDYTLYQTRSLANPLDRDGDFRVRWVLSLALRRVTA